LGGAFLCVGHRRAKLARHHKENAMARIIGIGGVFMRTGAPEALRDWYSRVLGIAFESWGGVAFPPLDRGVTVFSPFAPDSDYFAPSTREFMINFVVDDLDAVLAQAAREGAPAIGRDDSDPNGRFAWLMDPAGVKIELWQSSEPKPGS
jgi:predicted enzyme related to lactoylglutathione lyase